MTLEELRMGEGVSGVVGGVYRGILSRGWLLDGLLRVLLHLFDWDLRVARRDAGHVGD